MGNRDRTNAVKWNMVTFFIFKNLRAAVDNTMQFGNTVLILVNPYIALIYLNRLHGRVKALCLVWLFTLVKASNALRAERQVIIRR